MATRVPRRDVLKSAALATSALAAPGMLFSRSPNEQLGIAGIGVGGKGWTDVNACRTERIVAICDIDGHSLDKMAKRFPQAEKYDDFRRMLERKDIDAVTVSTPDHVHAVASMTAMRLGKHVYCQKPLTHSVYEARKLAEAAVKYGVATQMGNQGHSGKKTRQFAEWVKSGVIGKVREAHAWSDRPIWPQGIDRPTDTPPIPKHVHWDLWIGPAPYRPYHPAYHPFRWRGWYDFGTGALGDMACHMMSPLFWALDLGAPTTVRAEGPKEKHAETYPKWCRVHWEFPARDKLPPVRLTWHDGGKKPPPELCGVSSTKEIPANGSLLVGDKGRLLFDRRRLRLLPENAFRDFEPPAQFLRQSPGHYEEWIAACKTKSPTGTHFGFSGNLTEAVLLGNVAYRTGKKLEWDAKRLEATNVPEADQYIRREYRKGWEL